MLVANEVCDLAGQILAAYHQVSKLLSGNLPLSAYEAAADIREQLDYLIYPGFISNTPHEWLQHLPRYLQAIQLRLQKLNQSPDKDRQRRADIERLWGYWKQRKQKHDELDIHDPELEKFRWMLEELRVSQFAQELKTAFPVSVKRLEEQSRKVKG
jgi:ATP-dependent helicase HrpA